MSADAKPRRPHGKPSTTTQTPRPPRKSAEENSGRGADALQKPWAKAGYKAAVKTSPFQGKKPAADPKDPMHKPAAKVSAATLKQHRLEETKVQGENACRVCFTKRPQSVVKMYLEASMASKFADVMKYLAANKHAYHIVDSSELEKVAGSQHHGGVVLIVKRKPDLSLAAYLAANKHLKQDCLLALDGVGNPHNLGAIVRSCAHFGIKGVIMTQPYLLQSGAAARTAEGGVEFVEGLSCEHLPLALQLCKQAGYSLVTTSSHAGVSLYQSQLGSKVVVVFGEEMDGVSTQVANSTDVALQIPGSGQVESLNVSVAASLILGEWYRQQQR
ncbi:tRNA/rRNA methyltransferase [Rheinheimera riviphila]|uniref:tRNA/rRNA methyltransferase n=1 Tax=Rheinheimera riviphila TaxID=1834037 RepID=A0A437R1L9_9GAMM|nr:tRNA/rRNA methyltransferase [Rheinheimera riviphila]RVU40597.1 tRNA/rRNA methyltransferase [Rheinheimera riviphila]